MGVIRKTMSVSTLGLVDYRSDKERIAKYTRQTRNATRKQTQQDREIAGIEEQPVFQSRLGRVQDMIEQAQAKKNGEPVAIVEETHVVETTQSAPQLPPAGWYDDPEGSGQLRWFDGTEWAAFTKPVE